MKLAQIKLGQFKLAWWRVQVNRGPMRGTTQTTPVLRATKADL